MSRVRDIAGPAALLLAALCAIVVFLPPQGRIGAPLHESITMLLGPATFALPLLLAFVGIVLLVQRARPSTPLPRARGSGVVLVALGAVAGNHLLGGTSLLGAWLTGWLIDNLGAPLTAATVLSVIAAGAWLAFDLHLPRRPKSDAPAG